MKYLILKNCKELLTMKKNETDLIGLKKNISVLIENKTIKKIGDYEDIVKEIGKKEYLEINCENRVVLPGYIDCHTHLIFGESRVDEYVASFTKSINEIKEELPRIGLAASIYSTKNATDEELIVSSLKKLERMLGNGTTTVEIKSGYGIDKETELRQLRLLNVIRKYTPQKILSTYLGAHYYDLDMGKEKYIDFMIKEVMPIIKEEKLAQFSDIWCDEGYYTAEDSYKVLSAGLEYGMIPTLHSECYSAIGGAKVAAKLKAANIGHLNYLKEEDILPLKEAGVVGVLIPTTDFSVNHPKPFEAEIMLKNGLEVAIATNLNPGNWVESMDITVALACRRHKMTVETAIYASTMGGAKALRIDKEVGSLEEGKIADIQIRDTETYKNIPYKMGVNEIEYVIKEGKIVVNRRN